ncbi:cyclic peptide export ABC transporter [Desulfovibrio inopinatus]|uniref:cyclic peptide export ABC transporter n=1 Tax=Desulfovibrio inopinatus TaxID=102109 RepID=UPI000422A5EC|nr:cyclic peptide export ABC transporter [Desulfovibrio inopinatus]
MDIKTSGLYRLIVKQDKPTWARIVFTAVAAGLLQGGIVVIINTAATTIGDTGLNLRALLMFFLVLGAYALASHYAASRTIRLTESALFATTVRIAEKLRSTRLIAFERLGKTRIYTTLHTNTDIILETSKGLAHVAAGCVMIVFCGVYAALLSPLALGVVALFYLFGILVYTINLRSIQSRLRETEHRERRFKHFFQYIIEGFKELRITSAMTKDIFDNHIRPAASTALEERIQVENQLSSNTVFVQSFYYLLVASMIFLLPRISSISQVNVIKIAAIVLFSYGSVTRIVQSIPLILKAEKAVASLTDLEEALDNAQVQEASARPGRFTTRPSEDRHIRLENVTFSYPSHIENEPGHFALGPIALDITPGEMLFIVGGNGTGKTTLLKLIAGLYEPSQGELFLGKTSITDTNRADYRNLFSIVFPDFYLFDRFYGQERLDDERIHQALASMGLTEHVTWSDGRFGELELSAGQRKRLAIACAIVREAPILLFDEVAADLDPVFRQFFYEQFLPDAQKSGKTIIAVSHDDAYFHVADRVVKLDAGRIVQHRGRQS